MTIDADVADGMAHRMKIDLRQGDSAKLLATLEDESIHLCVTDPPYFIKGMGHDWDSAKLKAQAKKAGVVGGLPPGMAFDVKQGRQLAEFMQPISDQIHRALKPGAFYIAFTQARLYHRLAITAEDAGFEIRDMLGWTYQGQAKAAKQEHWVNRRKISDEEKAAIIASMGGRKTPQLKPNIEPAVLAQKAKLRTYVDNWIAHEVGLVDVTQSLDGKFAGNLMPVPKPNKDEKGEGNDHLTVKPIRLIEHIIKLFSTGGQTVLDPFLGSGSHGVAAVRADRAFVGFERDAHYLDIAKGRIDKAIEERDKRWAREDAAHIVIPGEVETVTNELAASGLDYDVYLDHIIDDPFLADDFLVVMQKPA